MGGRTYFKKISLNKASIEDLMKHVLQDYIALLAQRSFPDKSWIEILAPIVETELNKQHPIRVYEDIERKMNYMENSKYSPRELDATAALALLLYHGKEIGVPNESLGKFKSFWYALRDARNTLAAHSSGNETEYEIFEWGVITLGHLDRFVELVYSLKSLPVASKDEYRKRFRSKIKRAKLELELDYREFIRGQIDNQEMDDLLRKALSGVDPMLFHEVANSYLKPSSPKYNPEKYFDWIARAAHAGINSAQVILGDLYYEGNERAGIERDWDTALEWYEAVDNPNPPTLVRIASLYANGISAKHSIEEGQQLIRRYKTKWKIEAVERNGFLEHRWLPNQKKKLNSGKDALAVWP